jgi:hypothetical protein
MPFATSFDLDRRLMITRAWGHITMADVRAYQQELGQRPEFDPTWALVFDARDTVQFDLSSDEVRQLAETSVLAPSARRAIVATPVRSLASECTVRCSNVRWTDRRWGCSRR